MTAILLSPTNFLNYGYLLNRVKINTSKPSFLKCEHWNVEIFYIFSVLVVCPTKSGERTNEHLNEKLYKDIGDGDVVHTQYGAMLSGFWSRR